MLKKIIFYIFLILIITNNVFAEGLNFDLWGGYTTLKMKNFNNSMQNRQKKDYLDIENNYETGFIEYKEFKNVQILGVDGMFGLTDDFFIGGRLFFLNGKSCYNFYGESYIQSRDETGFIDNNSILFKEIKKYDYFVNIYGIMTGLEYKKNINEKINFFGKLFFGYGFIDFDLKRNLEFIVAGDSFLSGNYIIEYSKKYKKGCFIGDLSIGSEYNFTENFGVGFDVGYRLSSKVRVAQYYDIFDEKEDLELDFSGFNTNLSFKYKI